jgi:anti-sigma regulatory factor (Ser/Thr protein kinase)
MIVTDLTNDIDEFIVRNVGEHGADIARVAAERFDVSRQTALNHLSKLSENDVIEMTGRTKARRYALKITSWVHPVSIDSEVEEHQAFRDYALPYLRSLPENVLNMCNYGFTEMFNNVLEHAETKEAFVRVDQTAIQTQISIGDTGVGIFNKLQKACGIDDPRQALLELSKGKLTSDPEHHTGEGIFFTSRMFDEFFIISGTTWFHRRNRVDDQWLIETRENPPVAGTMIILIIANDSIATTQQVFDEFAGAEPDDYGFTRTHIPIELALYEGEQMMSRSQAKRILSRAERFREVILDFSGVKEIGQGFADEVFRVFANEHPEVSLLAMFTTPEIDRMITHAKAGEPIEPNEPQQLSLRLPAVGQG